MARYVTCGYLQRLSQDWQANDLKGIWNDGWHLDLYTAAGSAAVHLGRAHTQVHHLEFEGDSVLATTSLSIDTCSISEKSEALFFQERRGLGQ